MITEDYVSFEIAKLLKEKGFGGDCFSMYVISKPHSGIGNPNEAKIAPHGRDSHYYEGYEYQCEAPTLQMVMKWLREKHNLFIFISTWLRHKDGTVQYYYEIRNLNDKDFETIAESTIIEFDSPEKTCEAAIKYCLENLI